VNPSGREPIFNVPTVLVTLAALLVLIQVVFGFLSEQQVTDALVVFAFIPARYTAAVLAAEPWWIGWGPAIWTFVTYAFIHGSWVHLIVNLVWLLAFGTPLARRFGATRFMTFFLATAAVGGAVHLATHWGERVPTVGASAAVSGAMAAAMRFIFERGGPLGALRGGDPEYAARVPAAPLAATFRDGRALTFMAAWFGFNLLFGAGAVPLLGVDQTIAWEAHIGGFLAGLFGFTLFDPVRPAVQVADQVAEGAASNESEIIKESDKP
jgi:membrane associated rhomboid family serine protease